MSENPVKYIPCLAGCNPFSECRVVKYGDLIRIVGHTMMEFAPADARILALHILDLLGESACLVPPLEFQPALVDALAETNRGANGFGSTGV